MTNRVPWQTDAYLDLVRRACSHRSTIASTLGSQQGNRHVHWHLAPLPPGVPYEQQQTAVFDPERGYLEVPDDDVADLARRVGELMAD